MTLLSAEVKRNDTRERERERERESHAAERTFNSSLQHQRNCFCFEQACIKVFGFGFFFFLEGIRVLLVEDRQMEVSWPERVEISHIYIGLGTFHQFF